jgi:hypothetical protein
MQSQALIRLHQQAIDIMVQALIRLHQQAIDIMVQAFMHQNSLIYSLTAAPHAVITDRVLTILKVPDQRIVLLTALHRHHG